MLLLNGVKLLVVTFTPYATALLSKYINTPEQHVAVTVYAGNFAVMGGAMFFIWKYAMKANLMKNAPSELLKIIYNYYLVALTTSLLIFIVSFVSIYFALIFSGIMFALFLCPDTMMKYIYKKSYPKNTLDFDI